MPWNWGGGSWWGGRRNYQDNMSPPNEPIDNPNYPGNQGRGTPINVRGGEPLPGEEGGRGIRPGGMIDDTPDLIAPGSQPPPFMSNGFRFNNPLVLLLLLVVIVIVLVVLFGI